MLSMSPSKNSQYIDSPIILQMSSPNNVADEVSVDFIYSDSIDKSKTLLSRLGQPAILWTTHETITEDSEESTFDTISFQKLEMTGSDNQMKTISVIQEGDDKRLAPTDGSFPLGAWVYQECGVCLEIVWLNKRHCCGYCVCIECLQQYYSSRIEFGNVTIECVNPVCQSFVHRDEISARLSPQMKDIYHRLLLMSSSESEHTKPCPQCNHFYTLPEGLIQLFGNKAKDSTIYRLQCTECQFFWCFKCHSPWHSELSCKQYRKGDRLLRTWAKELNHGQVNAQKCPRCAIYIQRTSGCDHMHCTRCKTDFCYKCGDQLRRLKFFGDHYSKLSIFGCKYRFKADKPLQRKLIRGAVFASKVMLVPILGSLAVCAGAVVLVFGVAVLPLYAAIKIYRKYRNRKNLKTIRHQVVSTISSGVHTFD